MLCTREHTLDGFAGHDVLYHKIAAVQARGRLRRAIGACNLDVGLQIVLKQSTSMSSTLQDNTVACMLECERSRALGGVGFAPLESPLLRRISATCGAPSMLCELPMTSW